MSPTSLLGRRIPFAILLAAATVAGTVIGGMAQKAGTPGFNRIVWYESVPGEAGTGTAVRRALFSDGRFVALTSQGYRAGVVAPELAREIFATAQAGAGTWADAYEAKGSTVEEVEIELDGTTAAVVRVANPTMNFGLPSDLSRVLRLLSSADKLVATVPFVSSSFVFNATAVPSAADGPVGPLPAAFPFDTAKQASGVVIAGNELATLRSTWTDIDARLDPSTASRLVDVGGSIWRISWRLDLDAMGALASSVVAP